MFDFANHQSGFGRTNMDYTAPQPALGLLALLPTEILILVCSGLSLRDLSALACVSKALRHIVEVAPIICDLQCISTGSSGAQADSLRDWMTGR